MCLPLCRQELTMTPMCDATLLEVGHALFGDDFRLERRDVVDSTQEVVRAAAREGAAAGFCCVAAAQTAGRGRQGRTWTAAPGAALLCSLLLRCAESWAAGVPLAAGLAVRASVRDLGVEARVKWPNDVLVERRKLAGILTEVEGRAPAHPAGVAVVLGIGVNLRVEDAGTDVSFTSLHRLLDAAPTADAMLAGLMVNLMPRLRTLATAGIPGLREEWRRCAVGLGETVRAQTPVGEVTGVAEDLADDGALLVRTPGGTVRLLAGDVHLGTPPPR